MKIMVIILKTVLFLLLLAVLELNHNTLWGWAAAFLLFAGYLFLSEKVLVPHKWFTGMGMLLGFLILFAGILFLSWPPVRAVPAVPEKDPQRTEIITVKNGQLRGVCNAEGDVEIYTGIPYAKPPVGELRWKEPQDAEDWEGILEADHFAPMSMQPVNLPIYSSLARIIGYHDYSISLQDNYREPVSEDSLYLNIWRPAGKKDLPVLVYIHGGSLQTGQPWYADYSGEGLAKQDILVVNIGYRLGVFGFYADEELAKESPNATTGNYGLLDMIKALQWVQENIEAFGGDPDNVTLAGESAGAASVSALCTSPLAKGLFRRVILESSTVASKEPPHSYRSFEEALASGEKLKERYGVSSVEELRSLPAEKLVGEASSQHHITVDGYVLKEDPYLSYRKGEHNEEAILHGYNAKESAPFLLFTKTDLKSYEERVRAFFGDYTEEVLKIYAPADDEEATEMWADIYGAVFFNYPHYCLNRLANQNGIPVYEYFFNKDNGRLGSWHSGEEVYCYGNIPEGSKLYDEEDRELARIMSAYFASYAEDGDPNRSDLPLWEKNENDLSLMEFSSQVRRSEEKMKPLYDILDRMQGWE
ncbi:MAG: carboxylesterase family protein [Erysipelotrichaceae bacterium]|nr:carboxylesterase family protein [Erysipelotrichaceae bacterium]